MTGQSIWAQRRRDLLVGIAVFAVAIVGTALVFGVRPPFSGRPFEIRADVSSAAALRVGSVVRVGGVDVGHVTGIAGGPRHVSRITLRIDHRASAVRVDAALALRPRLALGGNDYVDLSLGTPGAPRLPRGSVIPLSRTSTSVPLDEVLDVFTLPTREAIRGSLHAFALGIGPPGGTPTGARGLQRAARELNTSLDDVRRVAHAVRGRRPGDLARAIGATGDVTGQLARDPGALADLVTSYDRVLGTLAAHEDRLSSTMVELRALTRRGPGALRTIDGALPALRRFAVSLQPALRTAPPALEDGRAALLQLRRLTQPAELRGLLEDLRPAVRAADPAVRRLRGATIRLAPISRCVSRNVIGTLNRTLPDGHLSTGRPVWQEMLQMGAALASFSNSFDGNGTAFRAGVAGGETALVAQMPGGSTAYGLGDIVGVAPQPLQSLSALQYRPDETCDQQALPDLGKRRSTELPKGLERVVAKAAPAGSASLLAALVRHDRSGVLSALRRLFPHANRPTSGGSGAKRRPGTKPSASPPRSEATQRPAPKLPEPVERLTAPLVDAVRDVVDALPILGSRR